MKGISTILRELFALFVDDGSLATALVIWSIAAWRFLPDLPVNAGWDGPILFVGYLLILVENLRRA